MSDLLRTLEPWLTAWVVAVATFTLLIQIYITFWKEKTSLHFRIQTSSGNLSKFRNVGKRPINIITCELRGTKE